MAIVVQNNFPPFFPRVKVNNEWYPLWYVPWASADVKGSVKLSDNISNDYNVNSGVALTPKALYDKWKFFGEITGTEDDANKLGLVKPRVDNGSIVPSSSHFLASNGQWLEIDSAVIWNDNFTSQQ